jgi:subtilisin family serine protease
MRKTIVFLTTLATLAFFPLKAASGKTLTIAVIDTGIDYRAPDLCRMGHKSFVKELPNPLTDENGHGTHVAGLVSQIAGSGDYCLVAIKYYNERAAGFVNMEALVQAINYAVNIKVDFINISGGGQVENVYERKAIKAALDMGITVVTAAGNENSDLGKNCNFFPACYDKRIVVVGNLNVNNEHEVSRAPTSNYGTRVERWQNGTDALSNLPAPPDAPGLRRGYMTGTSQAAGIATGWLVRAQLAK